jgi:hypothetical protein
LKEIIFNTLEELLSTKADLFPPDTGLFAVIDEAKVAVLGENGLEECFRSGGEPNPCPIVREIVKCFDGHAVCSGVILAGTLSDIVHNLLSAISGKSIGPRAGVFIDTGLFGKDDASHKSYIDRYLPSDTDSAKRFSERMQYWLSGR